MIANLTSKGFMPILSLLFKLLLLAITAVNTYELLISVSNNPYWALLGVAVFEGAMLYWWTHFKSDEGPTLIQMVMSLIGFVANLALVVTASAVHLGAIDTTAIGADAIPRIVIAAITLNLVLAMFYPIFSQDAGQKISSRTVNGIIWSKAQSKLLARTDELSTNLANQLADQEWEAIEGEIRRSRSLPAPASQSQVTVTRPIITTVPNGVAPPND